jgi:iron complex outermembrane receptor protein
MTSAIKRPWLEPGTVISVGAAISAILCSGAAYADQESTPPTEVETVTVAASRLISDAAYSPTPITAITSEQLEMKAAHNIAEQINTMPALAGSITARTNPGTVSAGYPGLNSLSLRNLGQARTLVLLDRKRLPAATLSTFVDINVIPDSLIKSVDVATGGTSAIWGSDAVAGVVNFVLDKDFVGLKGEFGGGATDYGDAANYKVSLSAGNSFADGRGHYLVSFANAYNEGISGMPRPWYKGTKALFNPNYTATNGQPQLLVRDGVGYTTAAPGGIVTGGPLRGVYFGPNGAVSQLNYGSVVSDPFMVGGDWQYTDFGAGPQDLDPKIKRKNAFGRLSYELAGGTEVYGEFLYTDSTHSIVSTPQFFFGNLTIAADNAFLDPTFAARMVDLGLTSVPFGTWNADLGGSPFHTTHSLYRYSIGATGGFDAFGKDWSWELAAYRNKSKIQNNYYAIVQAKYREAIDAVRNTNGAIVCRSTLTNPNNGCVPLNVLGTGVASPAGIAYVQGNSHIDATIFQDVFSATLHGEPWSTWAGPIGVAFGFEHRREKEEGVSDATSMASGYWAGNYKPVIGSFKVNEAFLEFGIPLAEGAKLAESLSLDLAVRATDYSTSGYVTTWKAGGIYEPVNGLRFRASQSRDIRAGNLSDLYQAGQTLTYSQTDPFRNNEAYSILQVTSGNPNIKPEKADTTNIGVLLNPSFLPRFSASVDYWDIEISDAITSLSAAVIVNQCFAGNQDLCSKIVRNSDGIMTGIFVQPVNLAEQRARGIDYTANYTFDTDGIVPGSTLSLRASATRYLESVLENKINPPNSALGENGGGVPDWRYSVEMTLNKDPFTFWISGRGISDGVYDASYIQCTTNCPASTADNRTVDNNHLAGAFYIDTSFTYRIGKNLQVYLAVDNVTNKDPAPVPPSTSIGSAQLGVSQLYYDVLGRSYRGGVRVRF